MLPHGLSLILWLAFVHLTAIYLFTSGFLLNRLALPDYTSCEDGSCKVKPTHQRAVVLIIDALRFDFVSPNPPEPASPHHHHVLTLPQELSAHYPDRSFLFNAYADPPTTTLQRIKGITTGSLPTFVDMGNNFGASSIAEDSILKQLDLAGKKAAFMGDDTWMSVFPTSFEENMTFPYDSFNVEDLHTVDDGVIRHLFPLLEDSSRPFDLLIGHFLGVDHVGHRVGPDHPSMKAKLSQMNDVLARVVEILDEDTLLVVLGDHGMDRSGDHGGDGVPETSSAMWIYSKGVPLYNPKSSIPSGLLEYKMFPAAPTSHRSIQQIDLLPTLSLLLGLPIPFNNLGSVIPELFWRNDKATDFQSALSINSKQIKSYLDIYRASSSGGDLDESWASLERAHNAGSHKLTLEKHLLVLSNYNRVALDACRFMWAQFNPVLICFGLVVLGISLLALWSVYTALTECGDDLAECSNMRLGQAVRGAAAGAILGILGYSSNQSLLNGVDALHCVLFGASLVSCGFVVAKSFVPSSMNSNLFPIAIVVLHTISFFSNSFTFWEERIVVLLAITSIVPFVLKGIGAPEKRLRRRILGFSALYAICVRLMGISTVCREEQHPYCHMTFYSSFTAPASPLAMALLAVPAAVALPLIFRRFLKITASHLGAAEFYLPFVLLPALLGAAATWILEFLDTTETFATDVAPLLRIGRTWLARASLTWLLFAGGGLWITLPLCLRLEVEEKGGKKQVNVLGFANAFGSAYFLLWSIVMGVVYLTSQLTAQIVLALASIALLAHLELIDSVRDVIAIETAFACQNPSAVLDPTKTNSSDAGQPVRFAEVIPVALLMIVAFYATGHQSTISSIQWKSAFILTENASYVLSPITVVFNSFGSFVLAGLAGPLLGTWNRQPRAKNGVLDGRVRIDTASATLGMMGYFACLLFGSALSAAILRRHLMVWKVFAPRFMTGAVAVLAVDIAALVGVGFVVPKVAKSVNWALRGAFAESDSNKK